MTITTRTQLDKATRQARTMAASLRQGQRFAGPGEREIIATLLEELSDIATRGAQAAGVNDA